MKSVAEFKRRLKVGQKLHTVHHMHFTGTRDEKGQPIYGDRDLGVREVSVVQSNSFAMKTPRTTGEVVDSWCQYPKAAEATFDGDSITMHENHNGKMVKVLTYTFVN